MNLTAGLVLLFLNLFLPGILFLRFYFRGEFSKEFTTKAPIARVVFYSLFPGFVIQLLGLFLYDLFNTNFTIIQALQIFSDLTSSKIKYLDSTRHFLSFGLSKYSFYTLITNLFAIFLALALRWIVIRLEFDLKFKILRFKNYWYYVFSGEILRIPKFKLISNKLKTYSINNRKAVHLTFLDILVKSESNIDKYRGFIVDYELKNDKIQELDKIYLMKAEKYVIEDNNEKKWVKIPGDIFILPYQEVLNLNITYYSKEEINSKKKEIRESLISLLSLLFLIVFLFFTFKILFYDFKIFSFKIKVIEKFGLWTKILFFLTSWSLITIPYDLENKKKKKQLKSTIYITIILTIISTIIIFKTLT
jgi:hypothetical protein